MGLLKPPIFKKISDIEISLGEKANQSTVTNSLALKANQTSLDSTNTNVSALQTSVNNIGNASPKGVYATVPLLTAAKPTGDTGIYVVTGNVAEVSSLAISAACSSSGNITITLNGVATNVALDSGTDTSTELVATKIRNTAFSGWTTGGTGSTITFTCNVTGVKTDSVYSAGTTGATGTMTTTTQGVDADGKWYYWNGSIWTSGGTYQATSIGSDAIVTKNIATNAIMESRLSTALINALDSDFIDVPLIWNSGKYYRRTDGALVTNTGYYYASEVNVNPGEKYKIAGLNGFYGANLYTIVDSNNVKILTYPDSDVVTPTLVNTEFTIPSNGAKLLINRTNTTDLYKFAYLSKKSTNKPKVSVNNIDDFSSIINKPVNLFNQNSIENVSGEYYNSGNPTPLTNYFLSHAIAVKQGDIINSSQPSGSGISGASTGVYMDDNKNILYQITNTTNNTTYNTFTVPNDYRIKYVSLSIFNPAIFMVVKNIDYPSTYNTYDGLYKLSETIGLNEIQKNQINKLGKLYGKKIIYDGDSICYGAGYIGGYPKIIAQNTGGSYSNKGIGGATLASGTTATHKICESVSAMDTSADIVCFEGGINDFWLNVPIGSADLTSETRYTGALVTTTLCGALESIFRQAIEKWYGTPICFVITHKIQNVEVSVNSQGKTFVDYYNAIVTICEKYSIPYVDLFKHSGFNCGIATIYNNFTNSNNGIGTPDGTHPNKAGYDSFYVPQITQLLESIIKR